jgi:ribosomal protein S18 acetylase RimI-like enzyme
VSVTVAEVPAEVTYPLRRAVLRPDGGDLNWIGDEDGTTFHLAARTDMGDVVGVVRFHPNACPWLGAGRGVTARSPWQLRGMATDPTVRGAGAGRALIEHGLAEVAARGGDLVWCDARTTAIGFYERVGFTVMTEPFDKPLVGPHVGMLVDVRPAGGSHSG